MASPNKFLAKICEISYVISTRISQPSPDSLDDLPVIFAFFPAGNVFVI